MVSTRSAVAAAEGGADAAPAAAGRPGGGSSGLLAGRWLSPEFLLYYGILAFSYHFAIRRGWEIASSLGPGGPHAGALGDALQPGWLLPGATGSWAAPRPMDLSDHQWRNFRSNLPLLGSALAGFVLLSQLSRRALGPGAALAAQLLAAAGLVSYLHGSKALFLLAVVLVHYGLVHAVAGWPWAGPIAIWAFNCGAWLAVQLSGGGHWATLAPALGWLDAWRGPVRWHIGFNLVVLRMISYGLDLHWQRTGRPTLPPAKLAAKGDQFCRQELPRPVSDYRLGPYLLYLLYPPLYLTGPTITFNAFASYRARPQSNLSPRRVAAYACSFCACLLLMEAMTHSFYFNAVAARGAWRALGLSAPELGITGYWVLNFMWLKFLLVWRLARLLALCDGVDPPENMRRCVNNNYDIEGFWKNWHSSYNLWLVRYLYIPLGGARTRAANVWVIFTFVALWHDLEPRLLAWAWLMCLFLLPEMLAKWAAGRPAWAGFRRTGAYRQLRAAAAAGNILVLMAANIVGFVIGLDGLRSFLEQMLTVANLPFLGTMLASFFAAAQIMFELREAEARAAPASGRMHNH